MSDDELSMAKLARIYIKIRTVIQQKEQQHEAELAALKEQRDEVATAMKDMLMSQQATSMRTDSGTVVLTKKTRYYAQDWEEMKRFIIDNEAVDLLEKRIAQRNMEQWLEQNPEKVPPGLNSVSEWDVSVRKATK